MKRFLSFLLVLLVVASNNCYPQSRAEKKAMQIAAVKEKLNSGIFKINITHIMPANQPMTTAHTSYFLDFKLDTFSCYLPYIGTSTSAIMGGQDLSIKSEKQVVSIQKGYVAEEEYTGYVFNFINKSQNERWECSLVVYDTGECKIRMDNNGKQPIAYQGDIFFPRVPKQKKTKK